MAEDLAARVAAFQQAAVVEGEQVSTAVDLNVDGIDDLVALNNLAEALGRAGGPAEATPCRAPAPGPQSSYRAGNRPGAVTPSRPLCVLAAAIKDSDARMCGRASPAFPPL